jgi:hypothetical protein
VVQYIFSCLPLNLAMKHVGSLLLRTAQRIEDVTERFALVHGVSCFRDELNSTQGSDDDTFFPCNAVLCELESTTVSASCLIEYLCLVVMFVTMQEL